MPFYPLVEKKVDHSHKLQQDKDARDKKLNLDLY